MVVGDLFFRHSNGKEDKVASNVPWDRCVGAALDDLHKKNPKYQSYYQRLNKVVQDGKERFWIDVGSWSEFYIWEKTGSVPDDQ